MCDLCCILVYESNEYIIILPRAREMNYKYIININEFVFFLMWIIFFIDVNQYYVLFLFVSAQAMQPKWHKAKQNVLNMRDPRMGQQDEIEV